MGNLTYVSLVRCGGAHLGKLVLGNPNRAHKKDWRKNK